MLYDKLLELIEKLVEENKALQQENVLLRLAHDGFKEHIQENTVELNQLNKVFDRLVRTLQSLKWRQSKQSTGDFSTDMAEILMEMQNLESSGQMTKQRSEKGKLENSTEESSSEKSMESMNGQNIHSTNIGTS